MPRGFKHSSAHHICSDYWVIQHEQPRVVFTNGGLKDFSMAYVETTGSSSDDLMCRKHAYCRDIRAMIYVVAAIQLNDLATAEILTETDL